MVQLGRGLDQTPSATDGVAVVMLPLPAQGHINQLLHLARLIAARGIAVHYVGSATHNRQARERAHWLLPEDDDGVAGTRGCTQLRFHDFALPSFASPPPNPDADIKFPAHLQPAFDAALHLQHPLMALLRGLCAANRRVVVVHDSAMSFAAVIAAGFPNAEAFSFHSVSAFALLLYCWEARKNPLNNPLIGKISLPNVSNDGCFTRDFLDFLARQHQMTAADSGRLLNSCRAIEGKFIDVLQKEPNWRNQKTFTIGPLNPTPGATGGRKGGTHREYFDWLDEQPPASVLYVSFGTTSTLSDAQLVELAAGLEASRQRFIWVLRDADRADIYAPGCDGSGRHRKLLRDYEKRVGHRGRVVRDWAPQPEILAHPATGGFLSHCGWNSCMEGISAGVPVLAWPMHSDQPRNAALLASVLRTAIVVREWERRGELVKAAAVRGAVVRLMASTEGWAVRARAKAVGSAVRAAKAEGGTSKEDFDAFIRHLTK